MLVYHSLLNVSENKNGIIESLFYSTVIDINQMDVIFFAMIITNLAARSDLNRALDAFSLDYSRFPINMAFTGKYNFGVIPG